MSKIVELLVKQAQDLRQEAVEVDTWAIAKQAAIDTLVAGGVPRDAAELVLQELGVRSNG